MKNHCYLREDRMVPGLPSRQNALQVALEGDSHVRQAERHANIAMRGALTPTNVRWLEALLGCGPIEPWDVDTDA